MNDKKKKSVLPRSLDFFFREGYRSLAIFLIIVLVFTYPLPYYVFTSGGITDLSDRFNIEGGYEQEGSYNLSYVNQVKGNITTYLLSFVFNDWRVIDVENYQISSNESLEEMDIRDKLDLRAANQTATMLAYSRAGKEIISKDLKLYIYAAYDMLDSTEKIKVGDIVLAVDDITLDYNVYKDDLFDVIVNTVDSKNVGDKVKLKLLRNDKEYEAYVTINDNEGRKIMGLSFLPLYDYEVSPKINFTFKASESGASAGLMTTLAIYDTLVPEDLTDGLKIAGTGAIDKNGVVGEIGGVSYKLTGAHNGGADIFFTPTGSNYEEAIKTKEKYNYDIEIVEIQTFDDAINYLKNRKLQKNN